MTKVIQLFFARLVRRVLPDADARALRNALTDLSNAQYEMSVARRDVTACFDELKVCEARIANRKGAK